MGFVVPIGYEGTRQNSRNETCLPQRTSALKRVLHTLNENLVRLRPTYKQQQTAKDPDIFFVRVVFVNRPTTVKQS